MHAGIDLLLWRGAFVLALVGLLVLVGAVSRLLTIARRWIATHVTSHTRTGTSSPRAHLNAS